MAAKKAAKARSAESLPPSGPASKDAAGPSSILTVSQLSAKIEGVLRDGLPATVRVVGEVSGFRDRTHWYFDIKDESAVVNCVVFQSAARRSPITPENGAQVVVKGRIEYYAKQGRVTLIVESIEPVGAGALDLAFRRLVEEVRLLGWLDPQRKRPLPRFPNRVAVITSRSAAALQDVLVTMRRRCAGVSILLADVRVQGDGAAAEISAAIDEISRRSSELRIDAILVTRGGGSKEDLWCFNEREVAEAIVKASVPVVAAIGHETDTTLAELVADERCATPTQAAMRLTPDSDELLRQLDSMHGRMDALLRRALVHDKRRVDSCAGRPLFKNPAFIVDRSASLVDDLSDRLHDAASLQLKALSAHVQLASARLDRLRPQTMHAALHERIQSLAHRLGTAMNSRLRDIELDEPALRLHRAARTLHTRLATRIHSVDRELNAVSPLRVLDRGFSVTTTQDGKIVRSSSMVRGGDQISTRLADGQIRSVVEGTRPQETRPQARQDKPRKPPDDGGGLFGG